MPYKILALSLSAAVLISACGNNTSSEPVQATVPTPVVYDGAKSFAKCKTCHTLEEGGKSLLGPNLWGIFGKNAGTNAEFTRYSKAFREADFVWTEEAMDAFLAKPREYVPGNNMTFVGLRKAEERAAVIAYIKEKTTPAE